MNAHTSFQPDDIRLFLPGIGEDEYGLRAKLRAYRNAASAMIASTECAASRNLAWLATEYITVLIYAPAEADELAELGKFAKRLMLTAMQAEELRDRGIVV